MAEMTLDQQRALALAGARVRAAVSRYAPPPTTEDESYRQIAAQAPRPAPDLSSFPRQPECTTAGYECVQDGYPSGSCWKAEQACNAVAGTYMAMPLDPKRSGTTVFPNGSTVTTPAGVKPFPDYKRRPYGNTR